MVSKSKVLSFEYALFVLQNLCVFLSVSFEFVFFKNASMSGKIPDRIWRVVLGQMYYFRARVERVGDILHRK